MKKNELFNMFEEWRFSGESEKIVETVLALPDSALDDDILSWLAEAYLDVGEYKKALAVLESQRSRMDTDYKWHIRMALSLFRASKDEECEDDDELRINILERAKVELARSMNLNPPEPVLEIADLYMERIEEMLDEPEGGEDDDEDDAEPELYEEEETEALEEHIKEYFGDFPTVFHEIVSPDIHCDICIVPPTDKRNYYTLITMGMGAHIMNIPDDLAVEELGRAELLICLPPEWKVGENSDEWFWPISLLKNLARLPINCDTWLGWGHSVDNQRPFADTTELEGSLLVYPEGVDDGAESCVLPNGDTVNFFEVIPLYRDEMNYKIDNDTKALLKKMADVGHVVDIKRPNMLEGYCSRDSLPIDSVSDHAGKISQKHLPLDPINACNHIAVFMRWCIEHDLIAPEFYRQCSDIVEGVKSGKATDIRQFITDFFGGCLETYQLNFAGAAFAHEYYNWETGGDPFFYPSDVDDYAEHYFGKEKYNSEEFQDEAYMFVPFDEEYYQGMSKYIDRAYEKFYPGFADYQYKFGVKTFATVSEKLNVDGSVPCSYEQIKPDLIAALKNAEGKEYTPLLTIIDYGGAAEDATDLADVLRETLNPILEIVAIADIPSRDPLKWAEKTFDLNPSEVIETNDYLSELRRKVNETFGADPAVLTFDSGCSTFFMPIENGQYLRFTGDGILIESV